MDSRTLLPAPTDDAPLRLDRSASRSANRRLAIVVSHPIQYYAPWFAHLHRNLGVTLRVFYLWDFGVTPQRDPDFGHEILWDVDLLAGYDHQFVPNRARHPGTHHFFGLKNPRLIDELLAWQPDALLLFGYRSWTHLRLIASRRLAHLPFIFRGDSHLLAETKLTIPLWIKRLTLPLVFRRFQAFLPVGQANARYFLQHGARQDQLYFAPHAVDQSRFAAGSAAAARAWKRDLGIPGDHRIILFVGKFELKKCPFDLVRAFLRARLEKVTLVLVGAGILEPLLREKTSMDRDIRIVPFQNQSRMPDVYASADLVVLPSKGPGETWGMVINEALSAGKPVIVSDHVGCHEDLVQPGKNGLVFPAGHVDVLTRFLCHAFQEAERLKNWGAQGLKIATHFTYDQSTAGLRLALEHLWKVKLVP